MGLTLPRSKEPLTQRVLIRPCPFETRCILYRRNLIALDINATVRCIITP